jgi:hypothetical protein
MVSPTLVYGVDRIQIHGCVKKLKINYKISRKTWYYAVGRVQTSTLHPRAKPPLLLHHILICVRIQFSFYSYYTTQSENQFLGSKRLQIKNLSCTKFHNFLRYTTFMLEVFSFEVVNKIWISDLRDSNLNFIDNIISNKKVLNYKVSYFIGSTTFILRVPTLEVVQKFKFSIFKKSDVLHYDKSNSNTKWFDHKVLSLLKINNFYFDHLVIQYSDSNILQKYYISLI